MRRTATLVVLATSVAFATTVGSATAGPTQAALERFAAANPGTGGLIWRLDAAGPTVVAAVEPDTPRIPASNMKLVTTAGALLQLGPDHRFTTRLLTSARATLSGGTLRGPLYLLGGGDPLLATRGYGARHLPGSATPFADLVRPLRAAGIRTVLGPIVGDEQIFDTRRTGQRWRSHYHLYSQPLSALTVNQSYRDDRRSRKSDAPATAAAVRLRAALSGVRISHRGTARSGRMASTTRQLARVDSAPLSTIVREMNVPSDNFIAEMLVKSIGFHGLAQGTSAAGAARIEALLAERGYLTGRERIVDGSGVSRANRLTPTSLVRLLAAADADPAWGAALMASLPAGGEGTLRNRFHAPALSGRVQAKTGYIDGVTGLSGRVVSRGGARYVFSLLLNTANVSAGRAMQDRVVTLLALGREDRR